MAFGLPPEDGAPRLDYNSYLQIHELLKLQRRLSDPPQHDELLFIVIHQVYELWFLELLHELDAVIARLHRDEVLGAQRLLRRCIEIERVMIQQIRVLETMTPNDFLTFRDHLRPASGFQSAQFRAVEFVSGLKDAEYMKYHEEGGPAHALLAKRLAEPSLGDAFYDHLRRRGFAIPVPRAGEDDSAKKQRLQALTDIYQMPDRHYDLYLLAESLLEYDELFVLWRIHHVTMVERMIGAKPGTGGSDGVSYLRKTAGRRFFPELWEVRTYLSKREASS